MTKVKVEMPEEVKNVEATEKKLPYDELLKIANSLNRTNAELQNRLNDAMLGNFFTRLEFLFKVLKYADKFTDDFVKKCIDEIQESMTIPEEKEKE
jgi:hypothetical protein